MRAAFAVFLLATGCMPTPLGMSVKEVDEKPEVEIFKRGWIGLRSSDFPCVHDIELRAGPDSSFGRVLWRMKVSPERQCARLDRFTIGQAPAGFNNEVRLTTVLPPATYTLAAAGIGYGTLEITLPAR